GGKNSLNRLIRCVCGKKIGPDPRNFNQRVSLGRNDLLIRTFPSRTEASYTVISLKEEVITKHASEITTLLKSIGYKDADNCIEKNEVWLNRQSSFWVEPILFENW
uniref:hypothetical protein n=1 Tax=Enterobacter cloacae TaxID=550 RepID=UPI0029314D3C